MRYTYNLTHRLVSGPYIDLSPTSTMRRKTREGKEHYPAGDLIKQLQRFPLVVLQALIRSLIHTCDGPVQGDKTFSIKSECFHKTYLQTESKHFYWTVNNANGKHTDHFNSLQTMIPHDCYQEPLRVHSKQRCLLKTRHFTAKENRFFSGLSVR